MSKRFLLILALAVGLLTLASFAFAQDTLGLTDALTIARESASEGASVTEASYDEDNACWSFGFDDGTEVCISDTTGELVEVVDDEPSDDEASEDADDEASEDADDETSEDADDETSEASEPEVTPEPEISIEEAIAAAVDIFGSLDLTASGVSLETLEDGTLVWVVELDDGTRTVEIDAITGATYFFGYTADYEASEDSAATGSTGSTGGTGGTGGGESSESSGSESSGGGSESSD